MSEHEWNGSPAPEAPDDWWVDDATGERVCASCGRRFDDLPPGETSCPADDCPSHGGNAA